MRALLDLGGVRATERTTTLQHGRIFHLEAGTGDPLVLLQGAGGGAANWYRLMAPLSAGRRVLAPELPGFGLSDPVLPAAPLGAHAADIMAAWLAAILPDEPLDLLATSFGGLVALHLALRLGTRVRRLALLNAAGLGRGIAVPVRFAGLPGVRRVVARPSRAGTDRLYRTLLTADRSKLPEPHGDAIVEYTWRSAQAGAGSVLATSLGLFAGPRGQHEVIAPDRLAAIAAPVLILWGGADRFLPPRHGPRAAAILPDAGFALLDGIGHSPNWEAPDRVLAAVLPFFGIA